jgi:hypothetical protein
MFFIILFRTPRRISKSNFLKKSPHLNPTTQKYQALQPNGLAKLHHALDQVLKHVSRGFHWKNP